MRIQNLDNDPSENQDEQFYTAEEYCEGYLGGFHAGRRVSDSEKDCSEGDSQSYCAGYGRGFAARRARGSETDEERSEREDELQEIQRLESVYVRQHQQFTEEQSERWTFLQGQIKMRGARSWQDILLELYRYLKRYEEGAKLQQEEVKALHLVRLSVLKRFSKTSF